MTRNKLKVEKFLRRYEFLKAFNVIFESLFKVKFNLKSGRLMKKLAVLSAVYFFGFGVTWLSRRSNQDVLG